MPMFFQDDELRCSCGNTFVYLRDTGTICPADKFPEEFVFTPQRTQAVCAKCGAVVKEFRVRKVPIRIS